jgi:hypothetical protein
MLLQLFIGKIDAKLLKAVDLKAFKPIDIKNTNNCLRIRILPDGIVNFVNKPENKLYGF